MRGYNRPCVVADGSTVIASAIAYRVGLLFLTEIPAQSRGRPAIPLLCKRNPGDVLGGPGFLGIPNVWGTFLEYLSGWPMRTYMSKMTTDAIEYNIQPEGGKFIEVTEEEGRNLHLGLALRLDVANSYQFATPNFAKAWERRPPTTRAKEDNVEPDCV